MKPSTLNPFAMKTRGNLSFLIVITVLALATVILWLLDPSNQPKPNYRVDWPTTHTSPSPSK